MEGKLIFYRWVNNHVSMEFCWCCRFCEIGGGYCYLFPPPFGVVVGEIALGDILESRRLLNRDLSWAECLQFSSRDSIRFLFFHFHFLSNLDPKHSEIFLCFVYLILTCLSYSCCSSMHVSMCYLNIS